MSDSSIHRANIRVRALGDGTSIYDVRFRMDGAYKSKSFADELGAVRWRDFLRRNGPERALEALDEGGDAGRSFGDTVTFAKVSELFMQSRTGLKPATLDHYRAFLDNSINPFFGHVPIGRVKVKHLADWINHMSEDEELSPKTIKNRHNLASSVFTFAQSEGLITRNPAKGMRLPRGEKKEMVFLSPREFEVIMRYIPAEHRPLITLLVGTGARWGEATAMQWRDVDFDRGTWTITRAWSYSKSNGWEVGPPKTEAGRRTILLPKQVLDALRTLRGAPRDYIFTAQRGGQLQQSTFFNNVWKPARRLASGLPVREDGKQVVARKYVEFNQPPAGEDRITKEPRVHDLRHTHASWLIADGVPLIAIKDRLGHESITTTVDRYGHLMLETQQAGRAATENALSKAGI